VTTINPNPHSAPPIAISAGARRTKLSNGLTVITKEIHTIPIVASVIWYGVGARNEALGRTGTSHFLEHMLFKGTERYEKGAIDLVTLKNGGANNAFTWLDYTAYYFTFASDRWEVALEIEADRMRNTLFDAEEFEAEKRVVIEELQIGLDSPWDRLEHEVSATAYRQHPYHNPTVGWIEDLESSGVDDMKAYYDLWYHPRNAVLVLVGDFDTERVLERVEALFGSIPAGPEPPEMRIVEPPQKGEKRVVVRRPTPVERLLVAYHAPAVAHADSYPLQIVEAALSTGKTSRYYKRLVEGDRSVTSVSASYHDHVDPGLFEIRAELKPESRLEDVERAILEEVERIATGGITDAELARIKRRIRADLILGNEQILSQAILLGEYETIARGEHVPESDRGFAYLDGYFSRIDAVTNDDVRRVAAEYLVADNRTVGTLVSDGAAAPPPLGKSPDAPRPGAAMRTGRRARSEQETVATHVALPGAGISLDVERYTLENGIVVLLAPNDETPAFACNVVIEAGSRYESDENAGLASLAGTLLEEGTSRRTADEIAEAIEDVGAHLATFGGYSHSGARVVALTEELDLGLDLAADCLRNPVFPEDRVALHVARRLALLKSRADQPRLRAIEEFDEIVFAGHPNHRPGIGYEASLAGVTREKLVGFHRAYFHPNHAILTLAGNFEPERAKETIARYFGDWAPADEIDLPPPPDVRRQTSPVERFVRAEKSQVNLFLGHVGIPRRHDDYYALLVLDTILGSSPGFTSRIPRILRDEMGLAYSTYSNITGSAGIDPGRFVAFIGTSPENLGKAVDGLRREIARIVEEPVEIDELEMAKSYLTGSFVFKFQTNAQIASYLAEAEIFDLGFDFLERYPRLVGEVSIDEVLRVAREHIDPSAMTLVVVGPEGS
jgi:zinc protease